MERVNLSNSTEYMRGDSEDEAEDKEEMWLPLMKKVAKNDCPEIFDESVWDNLALEPTFKNRETQNA